MSTPTPALPGAVLESLLPVLRERPGANKTEESLTLADAFDVDLPGGGKATLALARFDLVGDLQLRLVHGQDAAAMVALPAGELEELGLSAQDGVALALANLRRLHGEPVATPWHNVQRVGGRAAGLDSGYFLDRAFWRARLGEHPEGLVAAVPRTDLLLFAPAGDAAAVASMRRGIPGLRAGGGDYRLSSALYLFKDDRWSVLQQAVPAAT
jgi:hypothetical protein